MIKTRKYLPSQHLIMNASRKLVPTKNSAPRFKHKKQNLKQQWIWDSINSYLKQLSPLTWKYQLSVQINLITNLLIIITNLQLILLNRHLSSHLKYIPIHHNSPKIYLPWPSKATLFFIFKNGGMSSFLPSSNIYQQTGSGQNTNISKKSIMIYLPLSSNQTHILNLPQQKNYKEFSRSLVFHPVKDETIPS